MNVNFSEKYCVQNVSICAHLLTHRYHGNKLSIESRKILKFFLSSRYNYYLYFKFGFSLFFGSVSHSRCIGACVSTFLLFHQKLARSFVMLLCLCIGRRNTPKRKKVGKNRASNFLSMFWFFLSNIGFDCF